MNHRQLNFDGLERMVDAYFICAAWANEDDTHERLSLVPEPTIAENIRDVLCFWIDNHDDLTETVSEWDDWGQHGHDFYLTRNGHGAGFWDRGYGEIGQRLTKEAQVYGATDDLDVYLRGEDTDE